MELNEWIKDKLPQDIWNKKYKFENESFDEWLNRVSAGNKKVKDLIIEKKFLFGGRILSNRGLQNKGRKVTFSNCYVIEPPEDNIESIFNCAKKLARTYSYGGGCGIDISKLSPKGARVNNAAKETSGAVSFMDLYSLVTGLIGQAGRRGALMISLDCSHPDLKEFINIKSDLNKITKANISIKINDEFMKSVKEDKDWELKYIRQETDEVISKTIKAKEIFKMLAKMNWDYAEPGILNWDRISNWNLLSEDKSFEYAGVNPCFTGDMKLLTSDGYKTFEELSGNSVEVVNINGDITNGKVWCNGEKETIKLILSNKKIITCTPDHIFMTVDGNECKAKDLKGKKIMPKSCEEFEHDLHYVKLGFIQGDGQLSRLKSPQHEGIEVNIGYKDGDIFDLFEDENFTTKNYRAIYLQGYKDELIEKEFSQETLPERVFPNSYYKWTNKQKASFLCGCYSANGSIIKTHRIAYKTTCKEFANQLINNLKEFGISATITTNKEHDTTFENGTFTCKESYDININKFEDVQKFHQYIGFYQQYKKIQLITLIFDKLPYVMNIEDNGIQKVYDFKEPKRHWGIVEGFIAHNCAEEPLPSGGSCLLGSINLSEFVDNPFTANADFNYSKFKEAVKEGVIALNEVLHEGLKLHPLKEQQQSVNDWRQIGLGLLGWHDTLIKLGVRYGSKESLTIADAIGFYMIDSAIATSALLTKEYGSYPMYKEEAILKSKFFIENTSTNTKKLVKEYGLANSQLLTIAPTGSIGTMLSVSTGLEPIYNISYTRKTESLHGKDEYYKVYTPIVDQYMKIKNITDEKDLPDFFNTAMTLNYKERIDMQAVWQKYIDASISSTVNVPNDFTVEEVEDLYILAWEKGLKGVTIYRDNCARSGILTNTTTTNKPEEESEFVLERGIIEEVPDYLTYRKYKLTTGCGNLYFFVGIDEIDGKIYDCFTNTDGVGGCVVNTQANSRLLSAGIRGGVPVEYLVKQLEKSGTCSSYQHMRGKQNGIIKVKNMINDYIPDDLKEQIDELIGTPISKGKSCASAIANILKNVINELSGYEYENISYQTSTKDEVKPSKTIKESNKCPECGEKLIYVGGCVQCNCGWSRCS